MASAVRQHRTQFSEEEYLYLEERSETRNEFFQGEIFAMAGGSIDHSTISSNALTSLANCLRGSTCRSYNNDLRIYMLQNGLYTYADAFVICGTPELLNERTDTVLNPTLIVEVLSPSAAAYDRGKKFDLYQAIPTFQEYVLIWQDEVRVQTHVRQRMSQWLSSEFTDSTSVVPLTSLDLKLPIDELYEGVGWFKQ